MSAKKDQLNTPIHAMPPPLVRVKGTHREMGRQYGEAAKTQVRHSIENARALLTSAYTELATTWEGAQIQARKFIPFAQERYPQYVEEMIGLAEGAGVTFEDVAVLHAMEAVTMDALHRLVSFGDSGATALPHLVALTLATVCLTVAGARVFRYQ